MNQFVEQLAILFEIIISTIEIIIVVLGLGKGLYLTIPSLMELKYSKTQQLSEARHVVQTHVLLALDLIVASNTIFMIFSYEIHTLVILLGWVAVKFSLEYLFYRPTE